MVYLNTVVFLPFDLREECAIPTFSRRSEMCDQWPAEIEAIETILLQTRLEKMSSKYASRKKSKRKSRQLQALRDFTAADTCYSDGANPLSFHIGEIFTFLSRRDSYWVNVERTIWKNNPLLKTKDYPATERGIVPLDYVIEMNNSKQNEGMSSPTEEDRLVPNGDESHEDNVFKVLFSKIHVVDFCKTCIFRDVVLYSCIAEVKEQRRS